MRKIVLAAALASLPASAAAQAPANLASYVSNDDYPAAAILAGEQGTVGFSLYVGADGGVVDCTVTASSGSEALDETTCRIMRDRARFRPARDAAGRPTTDIVTGRIRWVLPDEEPPADEPPPPEGGN
ncbi:MAG TPA: energy transducer TonB [Allosphingosinicella sp.]|nr:energy transducer TonB [Allosphingosinicella sp.]